MKLRDDYLNRTPHKRPRPEGIRPLFVVWHEADWDPSDANAPPISYNYLIAPDGAVYHCVDEAKYGAMHSGDSVWGVFRGEQCDVRGIGVALAGPNDGTPVTPAQWAAAVALARYLSASWDIPLDRTHFVPQHSVSQSRHEEGSPRGYDVSQLISEALAGSMSYKLVAVHGVFRAVQGSLARREPSRAGAVVRHLIPGQLYETDGYTDEGQEVARSSRWYHLAGEPEHTWVHSGGLRAPSVSIHLPPASRVTLDTPLLGDSGEVRDRCAAFLLERRRGSRPEEDVRAIMWTYADVCSSVGANALIAVVQWAIESDYLSDEHFEKRNPARLKPFEGSGEDIVFPSWSDGVRAHVGRMLALALPEGEGTARQQALIAESLSWSQLSARLRGCAPTLRGMAVAWNGEQSYPARVRDLANQILGETLPAEQEQAPSK